MKKMKNNILTLENYCERYIPLTIVKHTTEMIRPCIDEAK